MEKTTGIRLFSTLLMLILQFGALLVVVPMGVTAAQDGEYTYTVGGGAATITGYTGPGGAIIIPSVLGGLNVVAIGDRAFASITELTSVIIERGISSIGLGAFEYCISLKSITIPSTVTSIGKYAFYSCTSLESITFLEFVAPTTGLLWLYNVPADAVGHAYSASNFPAPGGNFYGLTMGYFVDVPDDPPSDNLMLIALIIVIASIIVLLLLYMILKKEKTVPPSINPGQIPQRDDDRPTTPQVQNDSTQNKKLAVLFCHQCGREVPFDANLCPYCGNMIKK